MSLVQDISTGIDSIFGQIAMPKVELEIQLLFGFPTDKEITIQQHQGNELIEIDFPALKINKLYLIEYQGEEYAIQKISKHEFKFYDVIK